MINWMKFRWLYLIISGTVILSGIFSIIKWGFIIGVEFKGGTSIEYRFDKNIETEKIKQVAKENGIEVVSIQKTANDTDILKLGQVSTTQRANLKSGI